jgi:hypothetical protein
VLARFKLVHLEMDLRLELHAGPLCWLHSAFLHDCLQVCTSPVSTNLLQSAKQDAADGCLLSVSTFRLKKQLTGLQKSSIQSWDSLAVWIMLCPYSVKDAVCVRAGPVQCSHCRLGTSWSASIPRQGCLQLLQIHHAVYHTVAEQHGHCLGSLQCQHNHLQRVPRHIRSYCRT